MAVGIVVVSHSRALAEAAVALASEMVHRDPPPIEIAAGAPDGGFGTDATAVMAAIADADRGDGVAVFADLGSAIMSAELAIELECAAPGSRRIVPGPFVEGLIAGVVRASLGCALDSVVADAARALDLKVAQLSPDSCGE